jgi:hypothetical protein
MKRNLTLVVAALAVLVVATNAFGAQRFVITSSSQIKDGAVGYLDLSSSARSRLAGARGPRGPQGATGAPGAAGAKGDAGPQGPKGDTGAKGSTGATGSAGATGPAGADGTNGLAKASGLVAWTGDPAEILEDGTDASGSIHGASVMLTQGQVVTSLAELVTSAGTSMTHGMYAIYDANLNLVAQTADTPAAFQVSSQWVELSLTAPYTVPSTGRYYFADLLASSGTMPSIGNLGFDATTSARNSLPGGAARGLNDGPGLTAFPAILTNSGTGVSRCLIAR